jgi:hypothetical protein
MIAMLSLPIFEQDEVATIKDHLTPPQSQEAAKISRLKFEARPLQWL